MKAGHLLFWVLSLSLITTIACQPVADEEAESDPTSPVFGTGLVFGSTTAVGTNVSWGAATDDLTSVANLEYKLVISTSDNISTVADAEANGTVVMNWTANTTSASIASLTHSTLYYVSVLVKDAEGKKAMGSATVTTLCSGKVIFLATVANGNLGGISGADSICMAQRPTGHTSSTFKAMLVDGTDRMPCTVNDCRTSTTGRNGWVFTANQSLCTADYSAKIGTTDSIAMPVIPTANVLTTDATNVYTGVHIYFGNADTNDCANWTNDTNSYSGTKGRANGTYSSASNNNSFIVGGSSGHYCNSGASLYCVEQ